MHSLKPLIYIHSRRSNPHPSTRANKEELDENLRAFREMLASAKVKCSVRPDRRKQVSIDYTICRNSLHSRLVITSMVQ